MSRRGLIPADAVLKNTEQHKVSTEFRKAQLDNFHQVIFAEHEKNVSGNITYVYTMPRQVPGMDDASSEKVIKKTCLAILNECKLGKYTAIYENKDGAHIITVKWYKKLDSKDDEVDIDAELAKFSEAAVIAQQVERAATASAQRSRRHRAHKPSD